MKATDYIAKFLADLGIHYVFGLIGGAAMHIFDSLDRQPGIQPIFHHHEQAAALAAQAYARASSGLGVVVVTQGPGCANTITGLCAAWLDSIPCVFISGQARLIHTVRGKPIRQVAPQAIDIVRLVTPITKYAVLVDDAKKLKYYLQKAVHIARSGRPGPVWLDIPLDVQWAAIDPEELQSFHPEEFDNHEGNSTHSITDEVRACVALMAEAKRPMILAGHGIRLAHAESEFRGLVDTLKFPFLSSWNASDLLPTDHPLYLGRPGIFGQRGANLAMQNCDLLISIGSHLGIGLTGTMLHAFAREAKRVVIDVDRQELEHLNVPVDLTIHSDAKVFLREILRLVGEAKTQDIQSWRQKCFDYKSKYNQVPQEWSTRKEYVNPYVFVDTLSEEMNGEDVIVIDGGGTITEIAPQALRVKEGQRVLISAGICTMGTLPETIGACLGSGRRRTIFLCGDGSMQLNIQELQTIAHHDLPIKMFVLNNDGYLLMRHSQQDFFESKFFGSSREGGVSLPDFLKVAAAYGIKADRAANHAELRTKIRWALDERGPVLCDLMISATEEINPRLGFGLKPDGTPVSRPLEDMYPFLDRAEFLANMLIKPLPESSA